MKNNAQGWILFATSIAAVLVGWLWMVFGCLLGVIELKSLRFQGAGVLVGKQRKWYAEHVGRGYTTTICRGIWMDPDYYDDTREIDNRIESHEFVHVMQWEDFQLWGLVGGALAAGLGHSWLGLTMGQSLGMWGIIYVLSLASPVTGYVSAVLRYGPKGIYRDSLIERAAYFSTDLMPNGKSWSMVRDEERKQQEGMLG